MPKRSAAPILLLAGIGAIVLLEMRRRPPTIVSWPEGYRYGRTLTVVNRSNRPIEDTQIGIPLPADILRKARKDLGDIIVTDGHGNPLPCRPEKTPQGTILWVRISRLEAKGKLVLYLFYGNPNIRVAHDPTEIFEFFDDFNDLKNWKVTLPYGSGEAHAKNSVLSITSTGGMVLVISKTDLDMKNKIVEALVKLDENYRFGFGFARRYISYDIPYPDCECGGEWFINDYRPVSTTSTGLSPSNVVLVNGPDPTPGKWQLWKAIYTPDTIRVYLDETHVLDHRDAFRTKSPLLFRHWNGGTARVDWVRVRKFVETPPVIIIGQETSREGR